MKTRLTKHAYKLRLPRCMITKRDCRERDCRKCKVALEKRKEEEERE